MKRNIFLFFILFYSASIYSATHKILIGAMDYRPSTLNVHAGDKIIWINKDISTHTVTSKDLVLNSGSIRRKKTWSYIAKELGEHPYKCTFHPGMKGTITVE